MLADFRRKRQYILERSSVFERPLAGALNHRTIGERIAEGHAQLNYARARVDGRQNNLARRGKVGMAAGWVREEGRFVFEVKGHDGVSAGNQSSFKFSRKIPTSLSPRPEILTITISDFFIFGARLITSATACADSSAGMMPSVRASTTVASSASASEAETYSARPESFSMACSGPTDG